MERLKPWNLKQLYAEMNAGLSDCQTEHEKSMVLAFNRLEIKELANKIINERKFTPGEWSTLDQLGMFIKNGEIVG